MAHLLTEAELSLGHESRHLYEIEKTLRQEPISKPIVTLAAVMDELVVKRGEFPEMFSFARELSGPRTLESLGSFDIVHAHWTPGLIRISELLRLPQHQKLIVTFHDMYFATGGCHYTMGCKNNLTGCKNCPQVKALPGLQKKISEQRRRKDALLERADLITAPSAWMRQKVQNGNPDADWVKNIHVLGNPNPMFDRTGAPNSDERGQAATTVFLVVATDLMNPNKSIREICEALLRRKSMREEIWLVGSRGKGFESLDSRIKYLGPKTRDELIHIYANVSFVVSGSQEEAFGLSILEAATFGVPAIVKSGSGSEEFVAENRSGLTFTVFSELTSIQLPRPGSSNYTALSDRGKAGSHKYRPSAIATQLLELVSRV